MQANLWILYNSNCRATAGFAGLRLLSLADVRQGCCLVLHRLREQTSHAPWEFVGITDVGCSLLYLYYDQFLIPALAHL